MSKNDRVELQLKIIKYRQMVQQTMDDLTKQRIEQLIAKAEEKLRKIDE